MAWLALIWVRLVEQGKEYSGAVDRQVGREIRSDQIQIGVKRLLYKVVNCTVYSNSTITLLNLRKKPEEKIRKKFTLSPSES